MCQHIFVWTLRLGFHLLFTRHNVSSLFAFPQPFKDATSILSAGLNEKQAWGSLLTHTPDSIR